MIIGILETTSFVEFYVRVTYLIDYVIVAKLLFVIILLSYYMNTKCCGWRNYFYLFHENVRYVTKDVINTCGDNTVVLKNRDDEILQLKNRHDYTSWSLLTNVMWKFGYTCTRMIEENWHGKKCKMITDLPCDIVSALEILV